MKSFQKLYFPTESFHDYIHTHNNAVQRSGFCAVCRRAGGEYSGKSVKRGE